MIKVILIDADGVVIKKHTYFSERLAKKQGISLNVIMPFFKNEFGLCCVGKLDLKEVLPKYLTAWKWTGTIDELLEYWFSEEATIDNQVLEQVDKLRKSGIKVCLASDNEKYRTKYLVEKVGLGKHFDKIFSSPSLGFKKSESDFFRSVLQKLDIKPDEVVYWDDDIKNVEVAKTVGIKADEFVSFDEFHQQINFFL